MHALTEVGETVGMGRAWWRFAPIVRLHLWRCPAAVVRLVVAPVVDAIQRHALRPLAHVCKERLERHPLITHADSPPAIPRVTRIDGVQAALLHGSPRLVSRRVGHPVDEMGLITAFLARHAMSPATRGQLGLHRYDLTTAVTAAIPRALRAAVRQPQDNKATKVLAFEVFPLHKRQCTTFTRGAWV